jgi:N-acetylneuraminate synthase
MSANHDCDLKQALALVEVAAKAGVDAVKLQTYGPDSLTLRTDHPSARVNPIWGTTSLYELDGANASACT